MSGTPSGPAGRRLGGPAEPVLGAGSRDDPVAVAEADPGAGDAVLFPELVDPRAQCGELGCGCGIVPLREGVPELGAPLRRALDVRTDVS